MEEYDDEHRVVWAPAIPVFFLAFLLTIFLSIVGLLVGVVALVVFAVRVGRRQWGPPAYLSLGALLGVVVALLFALLSHALHG